ncbi:hypothetical protein BCR33DRAFT_761081 [Rhizoclosmatium globosum]|uniref:Uncharacterized protein n=1 Tax=Rhizoclosmatium globosum TaxID=329046 RepID=A0A1Y2D3G1_9FUNG|nr:hypothetical protein BCR33DRAFT_761081 [Rhizoclosmatium globosum]|eukprot:ORY53747.1 hypothetical protein BCR33DRAFT_761081 [Rhizoclosmatium globosum]
MSLLPSQAPLAHFPAGQHTSSPRSIPPSPPSSVVAMPLQQQQRANYLLMNRASSKQPLEAFPATGSSDSTDSRPTAPPRAPLGPGSVSLVDDVVNPLPTQPRREVEIVHRVPPISNRFRPYQPPQHLVALSTKSPFAPQAQFIQQPPPTHTCVKINMYRMLFLRIRFEFVSAKSTVLTTSLSRTRFLILFSSCVAAYPTNRQIPQNHEFRSQPQPIQAPPVQYHLQYSQPVSLIAPQPRQTHFQSEPNQGLHQTPHHIQQPIYRPIAPQQTPIPPTQPVPQTILPEQVPPSNKPLSKTIPFRILPNGQKAYPCPRDDCQKSLEHRGNASPYQASRECPKTPVRPVSACLCSKTRFGAASEECA